jgi:hypothetical protein
MELITSVQDETGNTIEIFFDEKGKYIISLLEAFNEERTELFTRLDLKQLQKTLSENRAVITSKDYTVNEETLLRLYNNLISNENLLKIIALQTA